MRPQHTKEQIAYQHSVIGLLGIAHTVMRRHGLQGPVTVDGGKMKMLAISADHRLTIVAGPAIRQVKIFAPWFHDTTRFRHAIDTAVEAAIGG